MSARSKRREPRPQLVTARTFPAWPLVLAAVGALALALRLVYLVELQESPFFTVVIGDSLQYDNWARQIAAGEWVGAEVFYQSPLYPYLLAVFYSFAGHDLFGVRLVQAALGAGAAVLLASAGREFFDARTGAIAGVLLAIYPATIFFDGLIQKSSLDIFLVCALLALLAICRRTRRKEWLIMAGVALGALALNRENARVLYPVIALWLYMDALSARRQQVVKKRGPIQSVLLFTLGTALLLIPVALRNAYVGGEFLVSTSQSGPNFYIGNRLGASGGYEPLVEGRSNAQFEREDATRLAEADTGRKLTPGEVSGYWWQRAVADIREAPVAWLGLLARKAWLTVAATEPADTESFAAYADNSRVLSTLRWFTFGVLMALAVFGAWIIGFRWVQLWVLYASFAVMALSVVMFFVFARYRLPLAPIAILFAAAGLASLPTIGRLPSRRWIPAAAAGVAVGVLLHLPASISSDDTYRNYGGELVRRGRPGEAVPLLQAAVLAEPDEAEPKLTLALALQQSQQPARALEELTNAVRTHPDSVPARLGLATALHEQGRVRESIPHYEEAIRLRPDSIEAMSNLALALQQSGDAAGALAQLERALALQPANAPLRMNLCGVLQRSGSAAATIACLRQAVAAARQPRELVEAEYALAQALLTVGQVDQAAMSLERALATARATGLHDVVGTMEEALRLVRRN